MDATPYGKLSRTELISEYTSICSTISARLRELGPVTQEYNQDFYPAYFQAPGNSVAAKEREANYKCLTLLNEIEQLNADIRALTVLKELIETILPYAT